MTMLIEEIAVIAGLIALNGLFAMSEIAIVNARKSRLQDLAANGRRSAELALALAKQPEQLLSTVQLGITFVSILTGVLSGATLARDLASLLAHLPWLKPAAYPLALALVVLVITYASIVFGEFAPKRVAIAKADSIALFVARPLYMLTRVLYPFVRLLNLSATVFLKLFGMHLSKEPPITEEEITFMLEEGTEAGVVEEAEQNIMLRAMRLGDRRVDSFMTPRTELVSLDFSDSADQIISQIAQTKHSHYPVFRGSIDEIKGVVALKDLWDPLVANKDRNWQKKVRPALFVPATTSVLKLLEHFEQKGAQIALIVDEYGGVDGMVTIDDVARSLLASVPAEQTDVERPIVEREDGSWLVEGSLALDEFSQFFEFAFDEEERNRGYQTLAGFVMDKLGHVPQPAEFFSEGNLRFEVVDMDGHRVDKVLVSEIEPDIEDEES